MKLRGIHWQGCSHSNVPIFRKQLIQSVSTAKWGVCEVTALLLVFQNSLNNSQCSVWAKYLNMLSLFHLTYFIPVRWRSVHWVFVGIKNKKKVSKFEKAAMSSTVWQLGIGEGSDRCWMNKWWWCCQGGEAAETHGGLRKHSTSPLGAANVNQVLLILMGGSCCCFREALCR